MATSSMPMPASSSARRPPSSTAGVRANVSRLETYGCSWQSVPACGKTHRSRGDAEPLGRLDRADDHGGGHVDVVVGVHVLAVRAGRRGGCCGDVVRISSAVLASRIQAYGLSAATSLKPRPQLADGDEVVVGRRARRRRGSPSRTSGRSAPAGTRRARPPPGGSCRGRRRASPAAGRRAPSASRGWRRSCGRASASATPRRRRGRRRRGRRRRISSAVG